MDGLHSPLRFCGRHHWQHLDLNGECLWCKREAALAREASPESPIPAGEQAAGVMRMLANTEARETR
jgi:hypothetical protein